MSRTMRLDHPTDPEVTCKVHRQARSFTQLRAKRLTCGGCGIEKKASEFPPVKVDRMAYCDDCRGTAKEKASRTRMAQRRARIRRFRDEVVAAFGGTCECPGCPVTQADFMTLEHAFDRKDRKVYSAEESATRPSDLWELVTKKRFPRDRYRMLCHNCKTARQQEGACPCEDYDVRG